MSLLCPWCGRLFPVKYERRVKGIGLIRDHSGPKTNYEKHMGACKRQWDNQQNQYQKRSKNNDKETIINSSGD
jgi:hypothetical protein